MITGGWFYFQRASVTARLSHVTVLPVPVTVGREAWWGITATSKFRKGEVLSRSGYVLML